METDYHVTRRIGKALTLQTAPAYSFGGRHDRSAGEPGPGPGAYAHTTSNSRASGFGTGPRGTWTTQSTPAGASYRPSVEDTTVRKPAYSFRGSNKSQRNNAPPSSPGPGAYDPSPSANMVKPAASAYTIGTRPEADTEAARRPAPCDYNPAYERRDVHAASLKFRPNLPSSSGPTPGPGEYDTGTLRRPRSEGKTFGASRDAAFPANGVPGPGEYGAPADPGRPRRSSWSIGRASRDAGARRPQGPGPAAYPITDPVLPHAGGHGVHSTQRSAPAYSFFGRSPYAPPQDGPSPAEYGTPGEPGRVAKPAFSMRPAASAPQGAVRPGPGAYDPGLADELVKNTMPSHTVGERHPEPGMTEARPGPDAYSLREPDGRIAVSLKFRSERRPDSAGNPAPHDYADKDFRSFGLAHGDAEGQGGTRRGYTLRPRLRDARGDRTPGPHYAVGCSTLGVAGEPQMLKSIIPVKLVL